MPLHRSLACQEVEDAQRESLRANEVYEWHTLTAIEAEERRFCADPWGQALQALEMQEADARSGTRVREDEGRGTLAEEVSACVHLGREL